MERVELARRLGATSAPQPGTRTVIATSDPGRFQADFAAATAGRGEVFLNDPEWGGREREQVAALLAATPAQTDGEIGWLMIPTGGSSGAVKFARHDQRTIGAAVQGFQAHFGCDRINAVGLLPLHHVSGFMAWMRCALSGGEYRPALWKAVEAGRRPELPERPDGWVVSLVPTQLERLLRDDAAIGWLRGFRCIFLGGAPAWESLLDEAAELRLPLSTGYGMTESAAMATALRPADFLAGQRNLGAALPHVRVRVETDGRIVLAGESLFRGYYPGWSGEQEFATEDLGDLDASRQLTVLGRRDGVIITGGEKVHPAEVEAVLRQTGQFADVTVLGLADPEWGQRVVAAYPAEREPDWDAVRRRLETELAPSKRPKQFVAVKPWPRNAQGKLNRVVLRDAVLARNAQHIP